MHEDGCEQEVAMQIPGLEVFAWTRQHCDNKPFQSGRLPDYNMTYNFTPGMVVHCILNANMMLESRAVHMLFPLLYYVMPIYRRELSPHNARRKGSWSAWSAVWDHEAFGV